jgi:hypothetical protein
VHARGSRSQAGTGVPRPNDGRASLGEKHHAVPLSKHEFQVIHNS